LDPLSVFNPRSRSLPSFSAAPFFPTPPHLRSGVGSTWPLVSRLHKNCYHAPDAFFCNEHTNTRGRFANLNMLGQSFIVSRDDFLFHATAFSCPHGPDVLFFARGVVAAGQGGVSTARHSVSLLLAPAHCRYMDRCADRTPTSAQRMSREQYGFPCRILRTSI